MPIIITEAPEDTSERNQSIDRSFPDLKKMITPSRDYSEMVINDLADVLKLDPKTIPNEMSALEYKSYQEAAVIIDLLEELKFKKNYELFRKQHKDAMNSKTIDDVIDEDLIRQINERMLQAKNLMVQLAEVTRMVERLESIKKCVSNETVVLEISADTERAVISSLLKAVNQRLKEDISDEEKCLLAFLNGKLDSAKTAIDTYNPESDKNILFQGIKLHIKKSELEYLASIDHQELIGVLSNVRSMHLDKGKDELAKVLNSTSIVENVEFKQYVASELESVAQNRTIELQKKSELSKKANELIDNIAKIKDEIMKCKPQNVSDEDSKILRALDDALSSLKIREDYIRQVVVQSEGNSLISSKKLQDELANEVRLTLKIGDDLKKDLKKELPSSIVSAFKRFASAVAKAFNIEVTPTLSKDDLRPVMALGKSTRERFSRSDGSLDESLDKLNKRISPPERRNSPRK